MKATLSRSSAWSAAGRIPRAMMRRFAVVVALLAVVACGGSSSAAAKSPTPSPSPSPHASPSLDTLALFSSFEGTYTGTWTNQTYGSTGSITAVIKLDHSAGTITATLTLGGNVFGAAAPAPETVTFKPTGAISLDITGHSATFGDVAVSFAPAASGATISFKAANVPSPRVSTLTVGGTITGTTMSMTYTVGFRDGTADAHGIAMITKQ